MSGRVGSTVKRDGPRENKVALHNTRVLDFTLRIDSLFFGGSPEPGMKE